MKDNLFEPEKAPDASIQSILLEQTRCFLANSSSSQAAFVHELLLPKLIECGLEQQGQYHTAEEYGKWHSNKVRQINGVINGHTNIPARWVNVWIDVLPAPYGVSARQEVLSLFGALNLPDFSTLAIPVSSADLASLFVEVADVMKQGAQACADGQYDHNDDPKQLIELSNELVDVLEHTIGQIVAISQAVDLDKSRAGLVIKALGEKPLFKTID